MPNITLRTTLEIITVVATCVIAATAVKGCSTEQQRSQQLESEVTAIKEQLKASDEELERRRRELQKSLTAYMSHYRTLISEANEAVAKYQNFDTPKNRKEYGKGFDQRKAELLKDAKPHIQALVDHVENWKPVLEAFGQMLDGRVAAVKDKLERSDDQELLTRFDALHNTVESDMDRLNRALDDAAKRSK